MDAGWYEVGQPQLLDFLFYVTFEINVHIYHYSIGKGHIYFLLVSLGFFFSYNNTISCPQLASVKSNNTGSWHDCDQFPGQTCGLGGICVLCGLEIAVYFPSLEAGRQW